MSFSADEPTATTVRFSIDTRYRIFFFSSYLSIWYHHLSIYPTTNLARPVNQTNEYHTTKSTAVVMEIERGMIVHLSRLPSQPFTPP